MQTRQADALLAQGQLEAAVDHLSAVLATDEDFAPALLSLAQARWMQGHLEPAAELLRRALLQLPQLAEGHNNLGLIYQAMGRYDAAIETFNRALAARPDLAWAQCNLGTALMSQRRVEDAIQSYRRAIAIDPAHVESHFNLANALRSQGDLSAALACYRKVLALRPGHTLAQLGVAGTLQAQGCLDAALEAFRTVLAREPDNDEALSGVIFTLNISARSSRSDRLREARRYGSSVGRRAIPFTRWRVDASGADVPRLQRMRVGILSGDLRQHPVGFLIESLLCRLDANRIELVAYVSTPLEDSLTARIKPRFAAWTSLVGMSDEQAAKRIHDDGVHVLVDLSGHTAHNRLAVLAWRPAPLQVSWPGYFGTTGVDGIDYVLMDRVTVPESARDEFTETVWYLPDGRFCFTPPVDDVPVSPLPARGKGVLTFGTFQGLVKIGDDVLRAWGRVLRALPAARLRIQNASMDFATERAGLRTRLHAAGIDPATVELVGHMPRERYLAAHADVDMILDTFPYTGGTTTCEALWMGVPTLTLCGDSPIGRQGASVLASAGLTAWITGSRADYVSRAVEFASRLDWLEGLRAELRSQVLASPLFDSLRFARHLEDALAAMWQSKIAASRRS